MVPACGSRMMSGPMLEGITVCGGVAIGPVHLRGYELDRPAGSRLPTSELDLELDRFRTAVQRSLSELETVRARLEGELGEMESRILSVHLAYLEDPMFVKEIEGRIRSQQLPLEAALAAAIREFDRIYELVESERMKERALDLRDVALRVIRNLDVKRGDSEPARPDVPHILAARQLSLADLFQVDQDQVLGIVAAQGGQHSHAGILARSLGIPTVTGIHDLGKHCRDGDFVIVDAGTGVVYVNPDERLRREYEVRASERRVDAPFENVGPIELGDGTRIRLFGACGNLGEVTQAMDAGLDGVGVYRTELLFLVDRQQPGEDLLVHHYRAVLARAEPKRVCFRLLDLRRDQRIPGMRPGVESNPALGVRGVRLLLAEPSLLRRQVGALLRLVPEGEVEILVPFVTSVQDLQRVRETIRAERANLLKAGTACADHIRIGAVIEVPAAAFHIAAIAAEADFLVVALDSLQQYFLAADRDNLQVGDYFRSFHPSLFRLIDGLREEARGSGIEVLLFGESASDPLRSPFYLGAGYRDLCVSPVRSPRVLKTLRAWTEVAARQLKDRVLAARTSLEVQKTLLEAER